MTEEVKKSSDQAEDTGKWRSFIIQAGFWRYDAGPLRVIARDEAHARELLPKLLAQVKDLEILSCVAEADIEHTEVTAQDDTEPSSGGKVIN